MSSYKLHTLLQHHVRHKCLSAQHVESNKWLQKATPITPLPSRGPLQAMLLSKSHFVLSAIWLYALMFLFDVIFMFMFRSLSWHMHVSVYNLKLWVHDLSFILQANQAWGASNASNTLVSSPSKKPCCSARASLSCLSSVHYLSKRSDVLTSRFTFRCLSWHIHVSVHNLKLWVFIEVVIV